MRKTVISLLFLVFALSLGACAGRQVRTGTSGAAFQASLRHEPAIVSSETIEPVVEPTPAVEPVANAPIAQLTDEELRLVVQQEIATYVHGIIEETNASNRAAAERMHRINLPPSLPDNDALVAALKIDPAEFRRFNAGVSRELYAAIAGIYKRVDALERAERRDRAIARAERRRASAVASVSPVVTTAPVEAPQPEIPLAAPAASEPVSSLLPQNAASVAFESTESSQVSTPQPVALFAPDAVEKSEDYRNAYLEGAAVAAFFGLLMGLYLWRRTLRSMGLPDEAYAHYPDGTTIVQEIRGGAARMIHVIMPAPPAPSPPIDAAVAESEEQRWYDQPSSAAASVANEEDDFEPMTVADTPPSAAASVANEEERTPDPLILTIASPEPSVLVDLDATVASVEPSAPVATIEPPGPPHMLASGTGQISSQGSERASVEGEIVVLQDDTTLRDASPPAHAIAYEEYSTDPPLDPTAPSTN